MVAAVRGGRSNAMQRVAVGTVSGVYGVRGWLRVRSATAPPERILEYRPWQLDREGECTVVDVCEGRRQGSGLVAKLAGIDDRDAARSWVGADIVVARHQLPAPAHDEYYWCDLIGATVIALDGTELGLLEDLMETGSNDVMVVQGERERLIPFIPRQVVVAVDVAARCVTVDWDAEL